MTRLADLVERHRPLRYGFVLVSFPVMAVGDRVRGTWNPTGWRDLRQALRWAHTGESAEPVRRKAARMTTPAERAPLYAAYAAARARGEEIGYRCEDDSIIQSAVRAYETAEMARLRAVVAAALAFADELDNSGQQPTLLAKRLRVALREAGPDGGS